MGSIKNNPPPAGVPLLNEGAHAADTDQLADKEQQQTQLPSAAANVSGEQKAQHSKQIAEEIAPQVGVRKLSAAEAERLLLESGYTRSSDKKRKSKYFDQMNESTISLPIEDVDVTDQILDDAQKQMDLMGAALDELADKIKSSNNTQEKANIQDMASTLVGALCQPTTAGIARLQSIEAHASEQEAEALSIDLSPLEQSVKAYFDVDLEHVDKGMALVAASLIVAGDTHAISLQQSNALEEDQLVRGMQRVVRDGNTAITAGKAMHNGISKEVALHRTRIPKR